MHLDFTGDTYDCVAFAYYYDNSTMTILDLDQRSYTTRYYALTKLRVIS